VNVISTSKGISALHAAAGGGHTEIVRMLLDHHADVNVISTSKGISALHAAAGGGHTEIVRMLLDHHVDVNVVSTGSDAGYTALHYAARQGQTQTVKLLLVNEADVNARTAHGSMPIDLARQNRHADTVKLFEPLQVQVCIIN